METEKNIQAVEELLRPVVEDLGYDLVDLQLKTEHGRRILRLLVDRPGGITLGECAIVSREVNPHLEVSNPIRGSFVLEVSSPGIQRPLKRPEDFDRFQGERVVVKTVEPVEGRKTFRGVNLGFDENGNLSIQDQETGQRYSIPLTVVREAHADPDIRF